MFNLCLCGLFIAGSCVVLILYYSVLLFILLIIVGNWKKNGFLVTKLSQKRLDVVNVRKSVCHNYDFLFLY